MYLEIERLPGNQNKFITEYEICKITLTEKKNAMN